MDLFTGSQSNGERTKILVVDDDLMSQHLMQVLLTREGYQVDVASNGLEAVDAIKYQEFDVVFMDLQMPGMDGLEASRRIREWENGGQQRTLIIALTADYLADKGQRLFEAGMDHYLSKPFEVQHIQRILERPAEIPSIPPARELPSA